MKINITSENGTAVAVLNGEIDHHSARSLRSEIDRFVITMQPERLAMDFTGITFMDSSGIALILNVNKRLGNIGGRLRVEGGTKQPMKVIKASGIDRIISIKEHMEDLYENK